MANHEEESVEGLVLSDDMRIEHNAEGPIVKGIPEGNLVLFLALIDKEKGFCVIYGPSETCLPKKDQSVVELWYAKIAIGDIGSKLQALPVRHGHKYSQGGGMVEFGEREDNKVIFFYPYGDPQGKSLYQQDPLDGPYEKIYMEQVYTVL